MVFNFIWVRASFLNQHNVWCIIVDVFLLLM